MIRSPLRLLFSRLKVEGNLGCRDHETVQFRISWGRKRILSRIATLDFSRDNFGLFMQLLEEIPWDNRKGFYKYFADKRYARGNGSPLMKEVGDLAWLNPAGR